MHDNLTKPQDAEAQRPTMVSDSTGRLLASLAEPSRPMHELFVDQKELSHDERLALEDALNNLLLTPKSNSEFVELATEPTPQSESGLQQKSAIEPLLRIAWGLTLIRRRLRFGSKTRSKPKLLSPPGSWARAVLSFVFSKKTFDNVYAQGIVDMRDEHAEALSQGRIWKARWKVMAYYINLVLTIAGWSGTAILKKLIGFWKIGL